MCCGRNCGGWIYICGGMGCKGEEKAFFAKPESWGDRLLTRAVLSVGPSLADENGWPERHYGRWLEALRVFGCQGTGGQRFEHLAAKRDWHVAALKIPQGTNRREGVESGRAFGLSELGVQKNTWKVCDWSFTAKYLQTFRTPLCRAKGEEKVFFAGLGQAMALLQKRTQS